MPPKAKRTAANQHDKRHENGLAAPGKRISRPKSIQTLGGAANGKPQATPPLPPADVGQQHMTLPATPNGATSAYANPPDANMPAPVAGRLPAARDRTSSDLSVASHPDPYPYDAAANGSHDSLRPSSPRRFETSASSNATSAAAYKGSLLTLTTTILSSCPLRDVIAILIILLQLGPTALTIVHFLYATLTFVPPTSPTSLSTLPSLTDMFQGSGGSPSLSLIIFVDIFILIIWLLLWVPLQNFILDLAQAVIAISLGGAAAGKGGTTNSMFLCVGIILASHFGRCGFLRQHVVSLLSTALSKGGFQGFRPLAEPLPAPRSSCYSQHGWVRTLLGVHILAQGLLRIIRRTLSRREQQQHSLAASKKVDPEAGVVLPNPRRNSGGGGGGGVVEANPDLANGSSTDGRPPGPSPAMREKEKVLNSRKKRRQATHVRSQQPFWAAIASTKVTVFKEMEQSHAANDVDEIHAREMNHTGSAAFKTEEDHVWISNVGSTEISFGARLFQGLDSQKQEEYAEPGSAGLDRSKPFYVRLNGAIWSSTRIREISTNGCVDDGAIIMYKGEIHGLTAFSNYHVEFVRLADEEILSTASLITSASTGPDSASTSSPAPHPTLRPASPTTTLKKSIAAAEQQLQDTRNRLKKNKKDHKSTLASLKKEVEGLNGRLSGSGSTDDRQRQRILQLERDIKQAKETTTSLEAEVLSLGEIPEEDHDTYSAQKQAWIKEKNRQASEMEEIERLKTEASREMSQVESDISSAAQKRGRLIARQAKLQEQLQRLMIAKAEGKNAEERKMSERASLAAHRAAIEQQYLTTIEGWFREATSFDARRHQIEQQIQYIETMYQQQLQQAHHSVPNTPEGPLPGTTGAPGSTHVVTLPHSATFPGFQFPHMSSISAAQPTSAQFPGSRARSSSMFSEVSGFTDDLDDDIVLPSIGPYPSHPDWQTVPDFRPSSVFFPAGPHSTWGLTNGINGNRKGSGGSGSGSGSTSTSASASGSGSATGSQRDPLSPVPASAISAMPASMANVMSIGGAMPWSPSNGSR